MRWCPICRGSAVFPGEACPNCGNRVGVELPAWVTAAILILVGVACISLIVYATGAVK